LIGNAVTREPAPGQGPVKLNLVQRRERNHGRGIPDMCLSGPSGRTETRKQVTKLERTRPPRKLPRPAQNGARKDAHSARKGRPDRRTEGRE
jgi:hypothetical protein